MATYLVVEVWQKWQLGDFTPEQAMGHLIQNMVVLEQRQLALEKRLLLVEPPRNPQPPLNPKP